ncbi:hypothetical protein ABL78_0013 [Leptomonas seymouri]|uniref:Uncharacterized protein n=1 Tax=Leptomonas seymouri TaxID=5684 RepID=A0A0N1PFN4_LEPSE|nr:hypothetical protein ABL78_0013 [Leptomonas seymouri]|eukprot:KPI90780.1 hypothetical protein ABL78_0013 [Leptomonas seymouri]
MARGNPYARGGDVMKTRSEKRKEKQAKLAKTNRVIRLKRRLGRIAAKKFAGQEDSHMTALMESYILRRKAERAAEKAKEQQSEDSIRGEKNAAGSSDGEAAEEDEEGSDDFSLGSGDDDSAFEMDGSEDDTDAGEEEGEDIAIARRKAAEAKGRHQASRGAFRGGRSNGSWSSKRESTVAPKQRGGRGGASGAQRGRGRGGGRGGQHASKLRGTDARSYQQRPRKVPTRSLY